MGEIPDYTLIMIPNKDLNDPDLHNQIIELVEAAKQDWREHSASE